MCPQRGSPSVFDRENPGIANLDGPPGDRAAGEVQIAELLMGIRDYDFRAIVVSPPASPCCPPDSP